MSFIPRLTNSRLPLLIAAAVGLHHPVFAADDASTTALQEELSRLRQENVQLREQLKKVEGAPSSTATEPAAAQVEQKPAEQVSDLGKVVVRGRNSRLATVKDVPASIAVVDGEELQRLGADTIRDIIKRASNIQRQDRSNARSSDLSIRGIGRKGNSEAQDPNVGVIVDGVSYGYSGLSAWDIADVNAVEVQRGPQGTLGGKNTSIGSVSITTKKPSFERSAEVSLRAGARNTFIGNAAASGPLIDDLLAWRGTFYVDKAEGYWHNDYDNGDNTYTDRNKISGKLQLLLTPSSTFNALLSLDLQPRTYENDNGLNFFHDPVANYSDGTLASTNTLSRTRLARRWFTQQSNYSYWGNYVNYDSGTQNQDNQRALLTGIYGGSLHLDWTLGEYSVSAITAYRELSFDARNDEGTPFDISTQGGGGLDYRQFSQEIRLTSPLGRTLEYVTGLYFMHNRNAVDSKSGWGSDAGAWFASAQQYNRLDADGNGRYLLENSLNGLRKKGTAVTDNTSPAIYGSLTWHITEPLALKSGLRVTREHREASNYAAIEDDGYAPELNETATNLDLIASKYFGVSSYSALSATQQQQVTDARAIRKTQLGTLYDKVDAESINKTQYTWHVTPTYVFNPNVTGYFAYQHGEKAPVAQVIVGTSANAGAEISNNFELGVKTTLLERTLTLNADIFLINLRDYQQAVNALDEYASALSRDSGGNDVWSSRTGNVPKVRVKGVEVDAFYSGLPRTTLRFSGAYNDARYVEFRESPLKAETNPTNPDGSTRRYEDLSGSTLPGASKWSGSIGVSHFVPLTAIKDLNFDLNTSYLSRYNTDVSLSEYGWVGGYTVTDAALGISSKDRSWSVSLLAKNAFNKIVKAYGFTSGTLETTPRWVGVQVTATF